MEATAIGKCWSIPIHKFSEAASFIDDIRAALKANLRASFKFKPVTDLVFVLRALSGLYWNLRGLAAEVPLQAVLREQGIELKPQSAPRSPRMR